MSLKLLQKSLGANNANAGSSGNTGGRGRGRGRQARTMSLQEFQQTGNSTSAGRTATEGVQSAWGRGRGTNAPAAGSLRAQLAADASSRSAGARRAPESRQSAWTKGAPQSAVDALWDAPAATAAVGDASWDEPAVEPQTWDDKPIGPVSLDEDEEEEEEDPSWDAAPAADWNADEETEGDDQEAPDEAAAVEIVAPSSTPQPDEDFSNEVAAWLQELKLSDYKEAVLAWCEDMGAATLQEVVDCIDDLVETIPMKPLHTKRMRTTGAKVAADIIAGSEPAVTSGAARSAERSATAKAASAPQDYLGDASAGEMPGGDDVGDTASGSTWCPGGGSFYSRLDSRASSTGTYAAETAEPVGPQSFYGDLPAIDSADSALTGGSVFGASSGPADYAVEYDHGGSGGGFYSSGGFYANEAANDTEDAKSQGGFYASRGNESSDSCSGGFYAAQYGADDRPEVVEAQEDQEDVYLKERYTEKATWLPKAKVSQSARKKKTAQQPKPLAVPEDNSAAEAARRLQEQIEEEERLKLADVRAVLNAAVESGNPDEVQKAIKEARVAGLSAEELREAKTNLERTLLKQKQRRNEAVCALKAALEEPRDDAFGSKVREALQEQSHALEVEGGREAVDAAKVALREWEKVQQKRQDAKMALQLAVRHDCIPAMKVALDQASEAGLADDDELVIEARDMVREANEREEKDAAASERLQRAIDARDLDQLQLAIQECQSRHLPLHGADDLLLTWREEDRRRSEATAKLQEATQAGDIEMIRLALHEACEADVEGSIIAAAEESIRELEEEERQRVARKAEEERRAKVAAKRVQNANVELHLARSSRDASRLEAAIAQGRNVGLEEATLRAAVELLAEVQEEQRLRSEARAALLSAIRNRSFEALTSALEAAESILPGDTVEVTKARELRAQVEREMRVAETKRACQAAEAELRSAIADLDWDAIQACQQGARDLGFAEDSEVMLLAASTLDELRDAHEVEEAERLVQSTEARLVELAKREAELAGASYKKERNTIGKEILALKNDSAYLSAVRFLKNPHAERKRREDRRLASERRAAEESERRAQRCSEAQQELAAAIAARDEAAVQALLDEDVLDSADQQAAHDFVAEQAERKAAAAQDGALLQFSYSSLDRRAFFGASIAMNEFLTDQYSMQEGTDFKLKVQKRGNSVLVAFRSIEFAEVVLDTAQQLAARLSGQHVVASAEIRGPADFSDEVEESLPDARQDAENLQRRPARAESEKAVRSARNRASGVSDSSASQPPRAGRDARSGNNAFSALSVQTDAEPGSATVTPATTPAHSTHTARPRSTGEADADGFVRVGTSGKRGEATETQSGTASYAQKGDATWGNSSASSAYPSKGKGKGGSANVSEDTMPLPRRAAAMLQRDRAQAELFHKDLKTFAGKFRVAAELRGLDCVVMKPMGFVHQETKQRARVELQRLLDYYFPERQEPRYRSARLRVSEDGAGIEMTATEHGYRVDLVEDFPGQDFVPGEVIVEINGVSLVGLEEEALEDAFADHFADGAVLSVMPAPP